MKLLLESVGSSLDRLVQVHALIYDSIEYDVLNRVYRQYVANGPPARTVWTAQIEAGLQGPARRNRCRLTTLEEKMIAIREVIAPPAKGRLASGAVRGGDFLFVSGLTARDPQTGEPVRGTTASETRQILANLKQLLEAAGSSLDKVVKVNVLIHSMLEAPNMNDVYAKFFPDPPPARTCAAPAFPTE